MAKNIQTKREREKAMVSEMIALYCRKQHSTGGSAPAPARFSVSAAGSVLLCEKLREITQLVYRDETV